MNFNQLLEKLEIKTIIRKGKKIKVKKSDREGYKTVNGKEVKMTKKEKIARKKGAKKAKKKRSTKMATIIKHREKSMKLRKSFDKKAAPTANPSHLVEGRNRWDIFKIKKNNQRWSFRNQETNKVNYIKIDAENPFNSLKKFLTDVKATPPTLPKTKGDIDYDQFTQDIIDGEHGTVYIKSGMFNTLTSTWVIQ